MRCKPKRAVSLMLCTALICGTGLLTTGCGGENASGKVQIELLQYKQEAVKTFNELAQKFNETHDNIELVVSSPNDATTILKTRLIKEDPPDMVAIGGDITYATMLDAGEFMDISDFDGLSKIKDAYKEMDKQLELVPQDGVYAVPYAANAAGVLYNKDMFEKNGWQIPKTWDEFIKLCETIKSAGVQPLYFGFRDTWTCLAPWNALAVDLVDPTICSQVSAGTATFTDAYSEVADKLYQMLDYAEPDPAAYQYNDACTAFARGQAAMYPIGNYAIPQIRSVNPDIKIDSFVMPGSNDPDKNILNSGNDLQFSVMAATKHKEECYEVLDFFLENENVQLYTDEQASVPCVEGDFTITDDLDSMKPYIEAGKMADYQDHHYPSEMSVDAMIQTYLQSGDKKSFLSQFDSDWERYNRDTIAKLKKYYEEHPEAAASSAASSTVS